MPSKSGVNRVVERRLADLCLQWGGELREVDAEGFAKASAAEVDWAGNGTFWGAPFTSNLGILWREKIIVYTGAHAWSAILHEMGHVFASRKDPTHSEEYDFLGWEYAIARSVGPLSEWWAGNEDYGTSDGETFGSLSPAKKRALIRDRVAHSRAIGLLDGWTPRTVR